MTELGIYVHWPYCARICPYCDFNVYRARDQNPGPLLGAIAADLKAQAARLGRRNAVSLFLGGGTPSLLRGAEIAHLIEAADQAFGLASDCEITLEANPEDVALFPEQAAAGVTRFSLGVQALEDAALKKLGRTHTTASALAAVELAAATGKRLSIDLIYAREQQNLAQWEAELQRALALPVEHLSLYQLTIEPETAFWRRAQRGELSPPGEDEAATLYELTQGLCEQAGFDAYEISNHARGEAARSRHNMLYWRSQDWVGVGPGAHGRVTIGERRVATESHRRPSDYVDAVREKGIGWMLENPLTGEERADELLIMGLRLHDGVDVRQFGALRGRDINARALAWLLQDGLVTRNGDRVLLTPKGRLLTNKIAAELAV